MHIVCTMAFGDCLITLSQLEQHSTRADWRIVGTGVTRQVSALLAHPLDVLEILPDKAAFNSIKEYGVLAAARDYVRVAACLREFTAPGDTLVFERAGIRNALLVPAGRHAVYASRTDSAYRDRQALVAHVLGGSRPWAPVARPCSSIRKVVINPCARYRHRWLPMEVMHSVMRVCAEYGWALTVIDPSGQYAAVADRVGAYLSNPPLAQAVSHLRESDFYIGPDSFFMHLAYYFGLPHLGFFHPSNLYFMTPGMRTLGNWMTFEDVRYPDRLLSKVRYLLDAQNHH